MYILLSLFHHMFQFNILRDTYEASIPSPKLPEHWMTQTTSPLHSLPQRRFTKHDEDGLLYSLHFCSSMLNNTLVYQRELALKKQNEVLLQVAKNLFTSLGRVGALSYSVHNSKVSHSMQTTFPHCSER